jgi:hypothetical protein
MVDRRFNLTHFTMSALQELSEKTQTPLLHPIRTDGTVSKIARTRQFLADFDPGCKALEDYQAAGADLMRLLQVEPKPIGTETQEIPA